MKSQRHATFIKLAIIILAVTLIGTWVTSLPFPGSLSAGFLIHESIIVKTFLLVFSIFCLVVWLKFPIACKSIFVIDVKKPLHKVPLFWLSIIIFVTPALLLSIPLMCFCIPKSIYYEELLKQLGFPIFIASLALPFTVSVARFHSSKQTAEKLSLDEKNENFKLYFEHKRFFGEHLKRVTQVDNPNPDIVVTSEELFYKALFPRNSPSRFEVFSDLNNLIEVYKGLLAKAYLSVIFVRKIDFLEDGGFEEYIKNNVRAVVRNFGMNLVGELGVTINIDLLSGVESFEHFEVLSTSYIPRILNDLSSFELSKSDVFLMRKMSSILHEFAKEKEVEAMQRIQLMYDAPYKD